MASTSQVAFGDEDTFRDFYDEVNVTVYDEGNSKQSVSVSSFELSYAVGYVEGEVTASAVDGFFMDDRFYGNIYLGNGQIFFFDSSSASNNQTGTAFNHRSSEFDDDERVLPHSRVFFPTALSDFVTNFKRSFLREQMRRSKRSSVQWSGGRRVCDLALVVDHLFFKDIGKSDLQKTLVQIFWIVKEANGIFQVTSRHIVCLNQSPVYILSELSQKTLTVTV